MILKSCLIEQRLNVGVQADDTTGEEDILYVFGCFWRSGIQLIVKVPIIQSYVKDLYDELPLPCNEIPHNSAQIIQS